MAKIEKPTDLIPNQMPPDIIEINHSSLLPSSPTQRQLATPTNGKTSKKTATKIPPPTVSNESPTFTPPAPTPLIIEMDETTQKAWRARNIGGLWTIDQNLNGWVWTEKEKWGRISEATESGLMAMMMLAASAKETNANCLLRRNDEDKIEEIYLL